MNAKLRYNTRYPNGLEKPWRLLINGSELQVDKVLVRCDAETTTDVVLVDGKEVTKYHISLYDFDLNLYDENDLLVAEFNSIF